MKAVARGYFLIMFCSFITSPMLPLILSWPNVKAVIGLVVPATIPILLAFYSRSASWVRFCHTRTLPGARSYIEPQL